VAYELTDPTTSTPEALNAIEGRFPAAAQAQLEFEGDWSGIEAGSLVSVRMPDSAGRCYAGVALAPAVATCHSLARHAQRDKFITWLRRPPAGSPQ
jgi:hypothetical protein